MLPHRSLPLLLLCSALHASAVEIQCPESIQERPAVTSTIVGWTVLSKLDTRYVEQLAVYEGTPPHAYPQVPDSDEAMGKGRNLVKWSTPADNSRRYWIGCTYTGTSAVLLIELKKETISCETTYRASRTGPRSALDGMRCH